MSGAGIVSNELLGVAPVPRSFSVSPRVTNRGRLIPPLSDDINRRLLRRAERPVVTIWVATIVSPFVRDKYGRRPRRAPDPFALERNGQA